MKCSSPHVISSTVKRLLYACLNNPAGPDERLASYLPELHLMVPVCTTQ
jgi:hypothetical protein